MKGTSVVIDASYDFEAVDYVPIAARSFRPGPRIRLAPIDVRRARREEAPEIHRWLTREPMCRGFGFPHPLRQDEVERAEAPDGTGEMEPVEFLIVGSPPGGGPSGLSVVYETPCRGSPDQEIDFGWLRPSEVAGIGSMRSVKIALLTYLFAACGAESVRWIRRGSASGRVPGGASGQVDAATVKPVRRYCMTLHEFRGLLERLGSKASRRGLPRLHPRHPSAGKPGESHERGDETDG